MVESRRGWLARVGGKHGKHPIVSWEVAQFLSDEDCYPLIEKTMDWYRNNAKGRERIGAAIIRHGLPKYLNEVVRPLGLEIIDNPEDRKKFRVQGNTYA